MTDLYKDIEKKIDDGDPQSAFSIERPQLNSRNDMTFNSFLKSERNQSIINKLREVHLSLPSKGLLKSSYTESPDAWRHEDSAIMQDYS